jgi:hypothetical protein
MVIDRSHRPWAIGAALALVAASIVYLPYSARTPGGARGGTPVGLAYGVCGLALMLFAALLSLRKRFPIWRIGRTTAWMRGHLWLGLLSFPMIVFHAGFVFGAAFTAVLMWLFVIVIVSGLLGAALQHVLPRLMFERVPMETIYEQIPHVRQQLVEESDAIVAQACGALEVTAAPSAAGGSTDALATVMRMDADDSAPLREFYLTQMRPFVTAPDAPHLLADRRAAEARFAQLRTVLPPAFAAAIDDLESLCEEERQLSQQLRMHRLLHGWLLVHVPMSFALVALAVVHVVMALRF